MNSAVIDDIYERINELTNREKTLRSEISNIRQERAKLKAQCSYSNLSRPQWISELPEEFWYPCYYTSKVISDLAPNVDNRNVPPDLIDWARSSGFKELVVNTLIYIGVAVIAAQLFVIIL